MQVNVRCYQSRGMRGLRVVAAGWANTQRCCATTLLGWQTTSYDQTRPSPGQQPSLGRPHDRARPRVLRAADQPAVAALPVDRLCRQPRAGQRDRRPRAGRAVRPPQRGERGHPYGPEPAVGAAVRGRRPARRARDRVRALRLRRRDRGLRQPVARPGRQLAPPHPGRLRALRERARAGDGRARSRQPPVRAERARAGAERLPYDGHAGRVEARRGDRRARLDLRAAGRDRAGPRLQRHRARRRDRRARARRGAAHPGGREGVTAMMPFRLDEIDIKILQHLQREARISNVELANRVGLSPAPCLRRVKALEDAGVIRKYVALLDPRALNLNVTVLVQVSLGRQVAERFRILEEAILERPEVLECYVTTGPSDFLMRVVVQDVAAYEQFQREFLSRIESVAATNSSFALKQVKYFTEFPLSSALV